jgi:hypothetical protein
MNNLVLITSVIKTPNKPLSYINTRSVYTHEERFDQTKKTIQSIKEKIPNAKIFIVECSDFDDEQNEYLKNNCDYFLNLYENETLRNDIYDISKSLGEGTMTYCALKNIVDKNIEFDNLIKISGRYWLSTNFNYNNFDNNNIVIKYIDNNVNNVFTGLYKLPKENVNKLIIFLNNNVSTMRQCIGYENLFANFIQLQNISVISLNSIGLEGPVSVSTDYYNG